VVDIALCEPAPMRVYSICFIQPPEMQGTTASRVRGCRRHCADGRMGDKQRPLFGSDWLWKQLSSRKHSALRFLMPLTVARRQGLRV